MMGLGALIAMGANDRPAADYPEARFGIELTTSVILPDGKTRTIVTRLEDAPDGIDLVSGTAVPDRMRVLEAKVAALEAILANARYIAREASGK